MEISLDFILFISAAVSIIVIRYWYLLGINVKEIRNRIDENSFDFCIEEAKIAEYSGKEDIALDWYYRAFYFEIYKNTVESNRTNRDQDLKSEYGDTVKKLGGCWPSL